MISSVLFEDSAELLRLIWCSVHCQSALRSLLSLSDWSLALQFVISLIQNQLS